MAQGYTRQDLSAANITNGQPLAKVDDTNITLTLSGTPLTSLLKPVTVTAGWTGTLGVARGGTNIGSYTIGDILYASGATTLSTLADVAVGSYLRSGGVATAPLWSTTTLPNSATTGDILYASAANTYSNLADVATTNVLKSGGVGVAPSWGKVALATDVSGTLPFLNYASTLYSAEGVMYNGRISITVASNNITLALKTFAGTDPSASDPVYATINGVVRTISAALSVTKNAGTNWFGNGLNFETDYFAYLGYNATDGVVIGFSPVVRQQYGQWSTTSTDWDYCAISTITTAASTDYYSVIGRFAATLGVTASFNWSVPTYTAINLIQRPIYETRLINFSTASTIVGWSSYTTQVINYIATSNQVIVFFDLNGTSNSTVTSFTLPFENALSITSFSLDVTLTNNSAAVSTPGRAAIGAGANLIDFRTNGTGGTWTAANTKRISGRFIYPTV